MFLFDKAKMIKFKHAGNAGSSPQTTMEVFKTLPEGTLPEVIDNALYMSPTPTGKHHRISMKISTQLYQFVSGSSLGEIFTAPIEVYLDDEENAVQPGIFFVSRSMLI